MMQLRTQTSVDIFGFSWDFCEENDLKSHWEGGRQNFNTIAQVAFGHLEKCCMLHLTLKHFEIEWHSVDSIPVLL